MAVKINYIKVPATGAIFASVPDLIKWADAISAINPADSLMCDKLKQVLGNLDKSASKASKITGREPELIDLITRVESIIKCNAEWQYKHEQVFKIHHDKINPLLTGLKIRHEYSIDDSGYKEDVMAYWNVISKVRDDLKAKMI